MQKMVALIAMKMTVISFDTEFHENRINLKNIKTNGAEIYNDIMIHFETCIARALF